MSKCERFLDEHGAGVDCGDAAHRAALANRAAGAPSWSAIERREDGEGWREYLDGEPIHCGTALELQGIEYHGDDYGEYTLKKPSGAIVRYELAWGKDGAVPTLHGSIAGHEFTTRLEPWMRFRWPSRGS